MRTLYDIYLRHLEPYFARSRIVDLVATANGSWGVTTHCWAAQDPQTYRWLRVWWQGQHYTVHVNATRTTPVTHGLKVS